MFLPFETTLALWFSPNAHYDWEPEPLPPPPPEPPSDGGDAACGIPQGLPAMRLVFKGVKWTAYPVFGMRENLAWEQVSQTHRESDEQQRDDSRRAAGKPRLAQPAPDLTDWERP